MRRALEPVLKTGLAVSFQEDYTTQSGTCQTKNLSAQRAAHPKPGLMAIIGTIARKQQFEITRISTKMALIFV